MQVYIDESGDPGTRGSGTRWLTFGAAIVNDADLASVERNIASVSALVCDSKPIKFSTMRHIQQKGAYRFLSYVPWQGVAVCSDTTKARNDRGLAQPSVQFNYPLRYMLTRISWIAKERKEVPFIFFDDRHYRFDLDDFKAYLIRERKAGKTYIDWDFIDLDRMIVAKATTHPPLSLADGMAHAAFCALQPDRYGNYETSYIDLWKGKIWRKPHSNVLRQGFTLMPLSELDGFKKEYAWLETL